MRADSIDGAFRRFADEGLEVLAGLRPRLLTDAEALPGSRILDGQFTAVQQAIGTPRAMPPAPPSCATSSRRRRPRGSSPA